MFSTQHATARYRRYQPFAVRRHSSDEPFGLHLLLRDASAGLLLHPSSLNEGALLSICWILAGLANGAFLSSAVDGHYDPRGSDYEEKGGPNAAGLLAVSTYVTTSSLRIIFALSLAVLQDRPVGSGGEELIPLEIPFGLALMSAWRALHSANTPRI